MHAGGGRPVRGDRRRLVAGLTWLAGGAAVVAFVAWEGLQGRFSAASHTSILVVVGAVLLLALAAGRGRQRKKTRAWARDAVRTLRRVPDAWRTRPAALAGAAVWILVIVATIGWDAASFMEQERSLPTLSRIFGAVTDHEWGRAVVFAAWLALGLYLALGWRLGRSSARAPHLTSRRAIVDRRPGEHDPPASEEAR